MKKFSASYDAGCCGPEMKWYVTGEKAHEIYYDTEIFVEDDPGQLVILTQVIKDVLGDDIEMDCSRSGIIIINEKISDEQFTNIMKKMEETKVYGIDI